MLQFYKPNAKNTGCSCTFTFNHKEQSMFASLMRQFSWDSQKRRGSFAGNKDNPKAKTSIKFNHSEAAGVVDAIESNRKFSAYHSSSAQVTRIEFSPYERDGSQLGFTLKVGREAKDDSTDKSPTSLFGGETIDKQSSIKKTIIISRQKKQLTYRYWP